MFTIQRNFNADRSACKAHGVKLPLNCKKLELYQCIAEHLGLNVDGIDGHVQLMDMIDQRNIELACVGVDEMTTAIDRKPKPVLRRDRKPVDKPIKRSEIKASVPKPIKRNAKPTVHYVAPGNTMAKALMAANLIEVV